MFKNTTLAYAVAIVLTGCQSAPKPVAVSAASVAEPCYTMVRSLAKQETRESDMRPIEGLERCTGAVPSGEHKTRLLVATAILAWESQNAAVFHRSVEQLGTASLSHSTPSGAYNMVQMLKDIRQLQPSGALPAEGRRLIARARDQGLYLEQ